jgi:two-component system OmpR family sensor kinase
VDLAVLVREVVENARAVAPARAIAVKTVREAHVVGDRGQLRRAMENLVSNAIRHTPDRTPIAIWVDRRACQVEVRIRDHGPGIPPGRERAVFERFWRGDESRGRADGGAGLGLAIVASIVSAHGGVCSASSPRGGGARFEIRLPAADLEASETSDSQSVLSRP